MSNNLVMDAHNTPSNPTVDDIEVYLVAHNGWSTAEFQAFVEEFKHYINPDNTTRLNHDEWTFHAAGFNL